MRRTWFVIAVASLLTLLATFREEPRIAWGDSESGLSRPTVAPERTPRAVDRASLSPMHREILDATEGERSQVEELNRRFVTAMLASDKLAIQREIESIKKTGQIAVMEILLRYARAEGRAEAIRQMEATLEMLQHPNDARGIGPMMPGRVGTPPPASSGD